MKILVTGGAGFIGSHIVDAYIAEGHDVVVLDDLSSGKKENLNPQAEFAELDVRDLNGLRDLFDVHSFDVVNHHAAQISVPASVKDPHFDADVNIQGGLNLAELSVEFGVSHFIFASTGGAIYGDADETPTPETYDARPESPYGVSKLSFEKYLHYFHVEKGLKYSVLRYSNVFGERQDPHGEAGVVAIFCKNFAAGKQSVIFGDGSITRDFVYVGDVVRVNSAVLERGPLNDFVNIGTGSETSIKDLYAMIRDVSGVAADPEYGPDRPGDQQRSVLDNTKAKEILSWEPDYVLGSSNESLRKTYQFFSE